MVTCPRCKKQVPCAGHPLYNCGIARLSVEGDRNVNKVGLHIFKGMRAEEIVNNLPFILTADGKPIARVEKP